MIWHGFRDKFYQFIKDASMPVVISELHFLEIIRELVFRDPMELDQPFLGIAPETFYPINIDLPTGKSFRMINIQMPVTAEH